MNATISSVPLVSFETWIGAIASSACIGFTSLVPWLFNMTFFERHKSQREIQTRNSRMEYLLSFSVGAILGDIFFHLIPESLESHLVELDDPVDVAQRKVGLSIIAGIFMFIIVEMILERWSSHDSDSIAIAKDHGDKTSLDTFSKDLIKPSNIDRVFTDLDDDFDNNNNVTTECNECSEFTNARTNEMSCLDGQLKDEVTKHQLVKHRKKTAKSIDDTRQFMDIDRPLKSIIVSRETVARKLSTTGLVSGQVIDPAGYLNLIANGIDNFTHGLAIGASFLAGPRVGLLTTFVIFIHEIPHEICDYAILVNSGFSRWDAVKAQSSVSLFGIMGTATALYFKSIDTLTAKTIWILPFSAGGFLHIALVNLLPEILDRRTGFRDSIEQIGCVILGIAFMGAVALS